MGPQASRSLPRCFTPTASKNVVIITRLVAAKGYEQKLQNEKEVKERL